MPLNKLHLVAGLGNPGRSYAETRHNIGFMVIDELSSGHSIALGKNKFDAVFGKGTIGGTPVILAKPLNYMNRSGPPIRKLADFFNIPFKNIIVIHDDIDLAFERLKIKSGGGHGGHNGIRSLIESLADKSFLRVRMGVGRPDLKREVTGHVLGRFSPDENNALREIIGRAGEAVETIISDGVVTGMNKYNK